MPDETDVLVIGAGPGGYPAAIRAAQLGKNVTIVEKNAVGGECVNFGCIPSKALISVADFYDKMVNQTSNQGINIGEVQIDFDKMQSWKDKVRMRMRMGVKQLLKGHGVEIVMGEANFFDQNTVEIDLNKGGHKKIEAETIIIATGTTFRSLKGFEIDEEEILSAKGILELNHIPDELLVIGAGYIGLELGTVYAKLGAKVNFVEIMSEILPTMESSLVQPVKRNLQEYDVDIYTESEAQNVSRENGKLVVDIATENGTEQLSVDKILLSIGKTARIEGLNLEKAGVETDERGFIKVNEQMETNISDIYAVGDCTGPPFLAHRAMKQAIIAAEANVGKPSAFDYQAIPSVAFTTPELATAGLTEEEAKEEGYEVTVGKAPFRYSGRAIAMNETDGFVRVVIDKETNAILGVQIVGPHASELISEAILAIEMGATAEDMGWVMHPHPTLSEMLMEAAESALKKSIHVG